jgi:hypothetical protein
LVTGPALIDDAAVVRRQRVDNRPMSANVCCPNCWVWTELGTRTTCRRCGAQLILPDGRTIGAAMAAPPPPPPPGQFGYVPGIALSTQGIPEGALRSLQPNAGTDWIAVARWFTIGYGVLVVVALVAIGLIVQHINVPITDPATGFTTVQTFDIGPAFAIAAIVIGAIMAVFAWLTQYTAARVIFLVLDGLALLSAISQIGVETRTGGVGFLGLATVAFDVAYGGVLLMSLLPRSQPAYA